MSVSDVVQHGLRMGSLMGAVQQRASQEVAMNEYFRGRIVVSELGEPDWGEVAARLGLLQEFEAASMRLKFFGARPGREGRWLVPFVGAFRDAWLFGDPKSVSDAVKRWTPYEAESLAKVNVRELPVEHFDLLRELAQEEVPVVSAADLAGSGAVPVRAEGAESVFDGLVGMEEQRLMLMKLSAAVAKHGRRAVECLHFVFEGNPGTGKTEVASRFVSYLDRTGVTDGTHKMVCVGGNDLVAQYVGQTSSRVKQIVSSARGGMLFIDEFYALSQNEGGYANEAVDTLTEQLDRLRDEVICVVAGYRREMERTLDLNPGLRDRFGYWVEFPDYTVDQLVQIFCHMAAERGFTTACVDALPGAMRRLQGSAGFSNARSVRRLVDHAVVEASWVRDEAVLREEDLERALPQCITAPARPRAGF